MKSAIQTFLTALSMIFISCQPVSDKSNTNEPADSIYFGGDIITMEGDSATYAEAIAVQDGKIVFVGSKADAEKMKGDSTAMNDLQGKTLLPGFNDSHSHFANAINIMGQEIYSSPPVGTCSKIADIIVQLQKCKEENNIKDGDWIIGWGYDETQLDEKHHPTKSDLDKAFPKNPVYIQHVSGTFRCR